MVWHSYIVGFQKKLCRPHFKTAHAEPTYKHMLEKPKHTHHYRSSYRSRRNAQKSVYHGRWRLWWLWLMAALCCSSRGSINTNINNNNNEWSLAFLDRKCTEEINIFGGTENAQIESYPSKICCVLCVRARARLQRDVANRIRFNATANICLFQITCKKDKRKNNLRN